MKRIFAALLLAGLFITNMGCANCGWVCRPFGPGTLCAGDSCCGGCGNCGSCAQPACSACETPACSSCASPEPCCESNVACDSCSACPGTCASPCGPLTWLFQILNGGYCGDGCGEMWWGDFHGAPPTCCEPCNRMGQWTGHPSGAGPVSTGGCSSCGGGSTIDYTFQNQPRVLAGTTTKATPVRQAAKPISTTQR